MKAYTIVVYLTDGNWGYVRNNIGGMFSLTQDVNDTIYFDTISDAKDYYYKYIKGSYNQETGVAVVDSKCSIVTVEGNCF